MSEMNHSNKILNEMKQQHHHQNSEQCNVICMFAGIQEYLISNIENAA